MSFYRGVDDLQYTDLDLNSDWGNETMSLAYRHVFSEKMIGNFLVANSRFYTRFGLGGDAGINEYNPLRDITFAGDISYFMNQDFNVFFGAEYKKLSIKYESRFNDESIFYSKTDPKQLAVYTKLKWKPNRRFIIEPGLRISSFSSHSNGLYPDLRLSAKFIIDENRFIVKEGLQRIINGNNKGIKSLINISKLDTNSLTVGKLSYWFIPKINAAGRLGEASRAVKLFTTSNPQLANEIALDLENENEKRKSITLQHEDEAQRMINADIDFDNHKIIVLQPKES